MLKQRTGILPIGQGCWNALRTIAQTYPISIQTSVNDLVCSIEEAHESRARSAATSRVMLTMLHESDVEVCRKPTYLKPSDRS